MVSDKGVGEVVASQLQHFESWHSAAKKKMEDAQEALLSMHAELTKKMEERKEAMAKLDEKVKKGRWLQRASERSKQIEKRVG